MPELGQMTLLVGGEELDDMQPTGSYSIGGKLAAAGELAKGAQVRVVVRTRTGSSSRPASASSARSRSGSTNRRTACAGLSGSIA